jgi:AraC-like DNA-binding protein
MPLELDMDEIYLSYVGYANREETNQPTAFHSHDHHLELQYISQGKGVISIEGRLYHVVAGDLMVYNKGAIHDECASPDEGMWFYNCGLRGLRLDGLPADHLLSDQISPVLHTGELAQDISHIFSVMYHQMERDGKAGNAISQYLLCSLLTMVMFQLPHVPKEPQNKRDQMLNQVKDYMDHHYIEELTVEKLSTLAHMSMSSFAHQFKKRSGFSPVQYIIRLRVGKAQQLLFSTDDSITDISMQVGFDNLSYFNNQFKKFTGMSPQNYRKLKIGKEQFKKIQKTCDL